MDIMVIHMATVTVLPTATGMVMVTEATDTATLATVTDTATPATVMDTATPVIVRGTAMPATPEWPSYSAGSLVPVITMGPLTASWDRRRAERFGPTSRTTDTQVADPVSPLDW